MSNKIDSVVAATEPDINLRNYEKFRFSLEENY